ncbi:hypothetical protein AHF37_07383 [Paragonimus kellicotti]|nr:hypothetical protein AHF37_07383 [Paragonimus kellicotti]
MSYDILWSPNDKSLFILIRKQEIILFSIFDDVCDKRSTNKVFIIGTGRQFALSVLGIWKNAVHPQCVAWVPAFDDRGSADCDSDHLVAITVSGGDIKLLRHF